MLYRSYTKKLVEFKELDQDMIRDFYSLYDIDLKAEPNSTGWINFRCILPTHLSSDKKSDGGICLKNAHYKCFSNQCQEEYNTELMKIAKEDSKYIRHEREWLSSTEFLMLHQGISWAEAQKIWDDFCFSWQIAKHDKPEKIHLDNHSNKKFISSLEWEATAFEAQEALLKNLDSDIVSSYIFSKGLTLETILNANMGYIPELGSQMECLVHIYYQNGTVVAIKGRNILGGKGGVKNSSNTLYLLQDLQKAIGNEIGTLILCEGETDCLVMRQCLTDFGFEDIPCCGLPGDSFRDEWKRFLQYFTRIIFVRQSDAPSRNLGTKIEEALGHTIEIIEPPFEPLDSGKDLADYFLLKESNRQYFLELLGLSTENLTEYKTPLIETCEDFCNNSNRDVAWIIPNFIEQESICHIIGPPKVGKTFFALQLMISASYGVPLLDNKLWQSTGNFKSLLIEEEGSRTRLANRFKKILSSYNLHPNKDMSLVHRKGIKLDSQEGINALRKLICKEKPNLLIFDPLASLHTGDENDAKTMSLIAQNLNSLLKIHRNMSIVILHHSRKKAAKEAGSPVFRGSTVIFASSDLKITMEQKTSKEEGDFIEMTLEGREVEGENTFAVTFSGDTGRHYMKDIFSPQIADSSKERLTRNNVEDIFLENPQSWFTRQQLQDILKCSDAPIVKYIKVLIDNCFIIQQKVLGSTKTFEYKLRS